MKGKHHTPEQIVGLLRQAEVGLGSGQSVAQVCQQLGVSEQTFYRWKSQYGGMKQDQLKRLKELEAENARLKKLLAESLLENEVTKEALRKKW